MVSHLIAIMNKESAGCIGALFFALFITPHSSNSWGSESVVFKAEVGISAIRFDYRESDDAGRILDKELGTIPGLSLKIGQRFPAWEWESTGSYHHGQVSYNGQTNLGSPYSTRTDEYVGDVSLRLGRWFGARYPSMPYAGIGYRRWDRDILPGSVNGLFESYRWKYLWLGLKQSLIPQRSSFELFLDAGLLKPINPEMHIDFKGTYPVSPVVYPESRLGLRLMLASSMALSRNTRITLEPYYEYWKLGRSPSVSTAVSTGMLSVYEPASETSNFGINLRFGWLF
jgi:hypothetical protein